MDIKLHSQKETKNKKMKQSIIQMNKPNGTITNDEVKSIVKASLKRKTKDINFMVRCLTEIGWITYLSYDDDTSPIENIEDYINGRIENTDKFNDKIYQIHLIVLKKK